MGKAHTEEAILKRKLIYALVVLLLVSICFGAGVVFADEVGLTFVGEDELPVFSLVAPTQRIDTIYRWGDDKVVIKCSNVRLVPVGEGGSMLPMVAKGHKVLVTTDTSDIRVGDFIVVDNLAGRYFHQVVEVREDVFITRGLNRTENDMFPVFKEDIVGVAIAVIW